MKKVFCIITMVFCCGLILLAHGQAAWAADEVVMLNFEDIAARVADYNNTVRLGKLTLSEAQSALRLALAANRERREQRSEVKESINETKEMIASGTLDETQLREAQSLLSTMEQVASSLSTRNTSQLERTIEAVTLQNTQSLNQLVNGAHQLFIRAQQLRLNIVLQQSKLEQAEQAVSKAETRLAHGLGTPAALSEAKLQLSSARLELAVMENQARTMLAQLRDYTGYKQSDILSLGDMPEVKEGFLAAIDAESDAEIAVSANFALKLLNIDRLNATATSAKRKIAIQIEQQEAAVRQTVKQKYESLLETQAKLDLAAAELQQAEQQLKAAETNFKLGKIAQNALDKQKAAVEAKYTAWQNAVLTLAAEIGDYQAKIGGLN